MNNAVADALGLIISLTRKIYDGNEYVKVESEGNSWTYFGRKFT